MEIFHSALPKWRKTSNPWTLDQIHDQSAGEKKLKLQSRDMDILQALLEHRFLTTSQINRMFFSETNGGLRYTQRRMKVLFDIGLVMKYRPKDELEGSKPFIFTLAELGFQLLFKSHRIDKEDRRLFYNEADNLVELSYIIHELHLNDICLSIYQEAANRDLSFEWIPTKLCRQSLKMPDGTKRVVEPDAVFVFYTDTKPVTLHVEYERSASTRRFKQKLVKWKYYRQQQVWRENYESEPIICVVGEREAWESGARKRKVVRSILPLRQIAYNDGFQKIAFLPTDEVEDETWNCLPYPDNSLSLWEILGLE